MDVFIVGEADETTVGGLDSDSNARGPKHPMRVFEEELSERKGKPEEEREKRSKRSRRARDLYLPGPYPHATNQQIPSNHCRWPQEDRARKTLDG